MSNTDKSGNSMSVLFENTEATIRRCNDDTYGAAPAEQDKGCGGRAEDRCCSSQGPVLHLPHTLLAFRKIPRQS